MTREEAKELLPIMQAFAEGEDIQIATAGEWKDDSFLQTQRRKVSRSKMVRRRADEGKTCNR